MTISLFSTFPVLTTERLILRPLLKSDDITLFSLRSDETVNRYIVRPRHSHISQTRKFIKMINDGIHKKNWFYWAICLHDHPELIGTICLWNFSDDQNSIELGYELHPEYHRKGYMDEAVKRVIRFSFETLGIFRLDAFTHRENIPSKKLLEKNGFKPDSGRRDAENPDNIIFCLDKQ
jgi:[ribosomal protein S5]-alanine N-acetyltransferase